MSGFDALSLWFSFICLRCGCLLWLVGFVFLVGLDCFSWVVGVEFCIYLLR